MRFSLRDLFWATVLAALALSWWMDNQKKNAAVEQAHRLHQSLSAAKKWDDLGSRYYTYTASSGLIPTSAVPDSEPDWGPLEEPVVKP
jgi:hypothetical protein